MEKLEHVQVEFHAIEVLVEGHRLVFQGSEPPDDGVLCLHLGSSEGDALLDLGDVCRQRRAVHGVLDLYLGGVYALVVVLDDVVEELLVTHGFHFVAPRVVFEEVQAGQFQKGLGQQQRAKQPPHEFPEGDEAGLARYDGGWSEHDVAMGGGEAVQRGEIGNVLSDGGLALDDHFTGQLAKGQFRFSVSGGAAQWR